MHIFWLTFDREYLSCSIVSFVQNDGSLLIVDAKSGGQSDLLIRQVDGIIINIKFEYYL